MQGTMSYILSYLSSMEEYGWIEYTKSLLPKKKKNTPKAGKVAYTQTWQQALPVMLLMTAIEPICAKHTKTYLKTKSSATSIIQL